MPLNFCGQIQYDGVNGGVHSDICWNHEKLDIEMTEDARQLMHDCLDEWLNNSNGSGYFWMGNPDHLQISFNEE
jgi:hypothetical protein